MKLSALLVALVLFLPSVPTLAATPPSARAPLRVVFQGASSDLDRDVLTAFAKGSGRPVEAVSSTGDPLEAVRAGRADLATGVRVDGGRLDSLALSREVLPTRLVAVTRRPSLAASIESLRWQKVGALRGSRVPVAVRDAKVSGAEIVEVEGLDAATRALADGVVVALLLELPEALVAQRRDGALQLGAFLGTRHSLVYAVRAEDRTLLAQVDAYLGSVRRTPSWAALLTRGLGPDVFEALSRARLTE